MLELMYFFQGLYGAQVAALTSKTSVASNDNCGDAAEGYYEEYVTGDTRYIVMFVFVCQTWGLRFLYVRSKRAFTNYVCIF